MTTSTGLWVDTSNYTVVTSAPAHGIQIVAPGTTITSAVQALIDATTAADWNPSNTNTVSGEGFAPAWQAHTAYRKDQLVTNDGSLYQAKATFVSAGTFSAGDWNAVGSAGTSLPSGGTDGDVLTKVSGSPAWAPSSGGGSSRFIEASIQLNQSIFSTPTLYFPILPGNPATGPVFSSLPFLSPPNAQVGYPIFRIPGDGGADVVFNYVEVTVTNLAGTEVYCVYTDGDIAVPAGVSMTPSYDDFGGDTPNENGKVGTDLSFISVGSIGAIKSTAGGVFVVQISFDITPPA